MQKTRFEVIRERFHLCDSRIYILQGTFPEGYRAEAYIEKSLLETYTEPWDARGALDHARAMELAEINKVTVTVQLPESLPSNGKLQVFAVGSAEKLLWFSVPTGLLKKKQGMPVFYIEGEKRDFTEGTVSVQGWAVSENPVSIRLYGEDKKRIAATIVRHERADVQAMFSEIKKPQKYGFSIEGSGKGMKVLYLVFLSGEKKAVYPVYMDKAKIFQKKAVKYARKSIAYLRQNGLRGFLKKAAAKVEQHQRRPITYKQWIGMNFPKEEELERQRTEKFDYMPQISIVVPLYKTPISYLNKMVESVKTQTYANWELCLSDGSGMSSPLASVLEQMEKTDHRIKVISHARSLKIAENTNAALAAATGDFIAFLDHDDQLAPDALYECVKALNHNPDTELIYSDEDKISMSGKNYFEPQMKPDFNLDLLRTVNYICHLLVVKRDLLERVGEIRAEYDGAQDYDFVLRCIEKTDKISHIPKVLYHWRSHENSTAENPESKKYAFEAGKRAVQAHLERLGISASVEYGEFPGLYRVHYHRSSDPLISILIPNKDHIEDLDRCIQAIEKRSSYRNYEYIVIENNSVEEKTFQYYRELEQQNSKARVVYWKDIFNYSEINNFGARYAKGDYLLLLNNDTEIINEDCLEELLSYCMREDVGAVGARLYYEDDTIQHAGVIVGLGGVAGHCFVQQRRGATGYCHRIICTQDYSAVTAACMMVKKSVYEQVGGFSKELAVAFNDIDFCMKVRKAGYLIVYNPYAELYHYESKSRGLEDTPEKVARFNREIETFKSRWPEILKNGDPYYSPNLTLDSQDFSLRRNR